MAVPSLLLEAGSRPAKQLRYAPIFTNRFFTGLWTQRNPLRDPSDRVSERFYGGRPDALIAGSNVELTNRLTLARRPGLLSYSTETLAQEPDFFYSFHQFLANGGTSIKLIVDTPSAIYNTTTSTATSIFTKAATAGQAFFQGVGAYLYFGDGAETDKWDGTTIWKWGITAPTAAPTLTSQSSGSNAVLWTASVFYSTMGIIQVSISSVPYLFQLTSVNADPTNPNSTQIGLSGTGSPTFSTALNGEIVDNTVTWKSSGAVTQWQPKTIYFDGQCIYDQMTNAVFRASTPDPSGSTSGSSRPKFKVGSLGTITVEGTVTVASGFFGWEYLGLPPFWKPGTVYAKFPSPSANQFIPPNSFIIEPVQANSTNTLAGALAPCYVQIAAVAGTSSATFTQPNFSITGTVTDGQLVWQGLGQSAWQASTTYQPWAANTNGGWGAIVDSNNNIQVCVIGGLSGSTEPVASWIASHAYALNYEIVDSNGNLQKVTTAGTSGATVPSWNTLTGGTTTDNGVTWTNQGAFAGVAWALNYGSETLDGAVTWVNCGSIRNSGWITSSQYYLPATGFFPPQGPNAYGSANIKDTNANIQFVISSGFSGTSHPVWNVTKGGDTTDNTGGGTDVGITWVNNGPVSSLSFTYTSGYGYVYSFKARTANDPFTLGVPGAVGLPGNTNFTGQFLPPPTGSLTGHVSTASPAVSLLGANPSGAVNVVTGIGSLDPQVDTVEIFRTLDGGATYFYLTDIPNPTPTVLGAPGTWTLYDATPDNELNILIQAPIAHANDPPLAGLVNLTYHFGRVWGSVGGTVYASGGPDTNPGNGAEAFPPLNFWTFPNTVTRLVPTSSGLIVFTVSDIYIIAGGPATATFYSNVLLPGYGLVSPNALDVNGGIIYFFTGARQFLALDPSSGMSEIGMAIGDQLLNLNPANAYVTFHIGGSTDSAVYLADGSTGWYRCNPNQAPEGGAVWSPKATIVGGCQAVQSTEVTAGVRKLLVGSTNSGSGTILNRDLNTFSDSGVPYGANFTMGSLILAQPGQLAELGFTTADFVATGSQPTISYLLDEIGPPGTFVPFVGFVPDPPQLQPSQSLFANRYYFSQSAEPAWCRHMQVKVDFGSTDTVQNELLTLTIFGSHWQER